MPEDLAGQALFEALQAVLGITAQPQPARPPLLDTTLIQALLPEPGSPGEVCNLLQLLQLLQGGQSHVCSRLHSLALSGGIPPCDLAAVAGIVEKAAQAEPRMPTSMLSLVAQQQQAQQQQAQQQQAQQQQAQQQLQQMQQRLQMQVQMQTPGVAASPNHQEDVQLQQLLLAAMPGLLQPQPSHALGHLASVQQALGLPTPNGTH
jgi:hypothetical protein